MLDQQVLEEIYTIAEKVGAHQVLTEREQAMYDDILEDAGYYQVFCLYTAMIDFPTFYEQSVSGEKQKVKNCRFFCSKNRYKMRSILEVSSEQLH